MDLPINSDFPWNTMIDMTREGDRGVGISLGAIHEQLCVIADLQRIALERAT